MSVLTLPTLSVPFPAFAHSQAEIIDQNTLTWARKFHLLPSHTPDEWFLTARFGWLAAYLAPQVSVRTLQLLSDWNTWAILWDDMCDLPEFHHNPSRLAQIQHTFLAVLQGNHPDEHSLLPAQALWNIRQRLLFECSSEQLTQFITHVEEFFAGCLWEVKNRTYQHPVDIETYIPMRRLTSGMYTALKIVELADHIALPDAIWQDPSILRLRELATNAVCWANDLISLDKELQQADIHNLVLILHRQYHMSLSTSIAMTIALHDGVVTEFLSAEQRLPSFGPSLDQQLARYVALLHSFMAGNIAWSDYSGRYRPGKVLRERVYGASV